MISQKGGGMSISTDSVLLRASLTRSMGLLVNLMKYVVGVHRWIANTEGLNLLGHQGRDPASADFIDRPSAAPLLLLTRCLCHCSWS